MGQNQSGQVNPLLKDWQQHAVQSNIFINSQTSQQAECHVLNLKKAQQALVKKRMQDNHNFVGRILYYEPVQKNKTIKDQGKYYIYTEKLYRLSYDLWVPVTSALSIFKGFRRLTRVYGFTNVTPNMIKVNYKKQIRVWINQSLIKNQPFHSINNQQEMVSDIIKIVIDFEPALAGILINCQNFNEAVNNIINVSNTNKVNNRNQEKFSFIGLEKSMMGNKTNFRSTKQTQGDELKPLNDSGELRENLKKDNTRVAQIKSPKNFLQNVNSPTQPFYLDTRSNDSKSLYSSGPRKLIQPNNIITHEKNALSYSEQANVIKSPINLNTSQPQKFMSANRNLKPVEPKNFNTISNFNNSVLSSNKTQKVQTKTQSLINANFMPTYSNIPNSHNYSNNYLSNYQPVFQANYPNLSQPSKEANKFKQMLHKPSSNPGGYGERKINNTMGSRTNNQKIDITYENQSKSQYYGPTDKSEINTSRDITQSQSYSNIRYPMPTVVSGITTPQHGDPNRTKTQQFYNLNSNHAPRFKTNYLQTTNQQSQKPMIAQSTIQIQKKPQRIYTHNHTSTTPNKLPTNPPNINNNINSFNNNIAHNLNINPNLTQSNKSQQNKKLLKIKQAQKIKEQMSILGLENSATKSKQLGNDKSTRDLLIKKKVEQKNKKHQDLKNAISKLLKE